MVDSAVLAATNEKYTGRRFVFCFCQPALERWFEPVDVSFLKFWPDFFPTDKKNEVMNSAALAAFAGKSKQSTQCFGRVIC